MNNFKRISTTDANELILRQTNLIDIRDQNSFNTKHIDNAINLNDENIESFIKEADKKIPTIVYCYHGHSSQNAAQYLSSMGFTEVYSVDGGFEDWKKSVI